MSIIFKEAWDKLVHRDRFDTELSQQWVLRPGRKGATLNARRTVSVPMVLGSWKHRLPFSIFMPKRNISRCVMDEVKIARRHGPPGGRRCGGTVHITDSVTTTVITVVSKVTDCTDETREKMAGLLRLRAETISVSDDDLGSKAIKQAPHRLPVRQNEDVETHVQRMLERGLIEPTVGPWFSLMVLVNKKDGSSLFCVDYRELNEVTRKDAQLLPRIDATLDASASAKWITTLDLASGYWQVEVDGRDHEETAFAIPLGLNQFKVMPFGLCNAPGTFQRLMQRNLSGLIKPEKCQLMKKQMIYLRHVTTPAGIKSDPQMTAVVQQWCILRCVREVRQFLGLASYYRLFIKDYARVADPLHELTRKGEKWHWGPSQEGASKLLLVSTLVLGHPDFSRPCALDVDDSDAAIRAVLSQTKEDVLSTATCCTVASIQSTNITNERAPEQLPAIMHMSASSSVNRLPTKARRRRKEKQSRRKPAEMAAQGYQPVDTGPSSISDECANHPVGMMNEPT
ncbi:Retrovirus-related Pol polyprotein from transposon 17.6 [Trichinella sp. T8]|nr:Retrovirus-related Pol polyprotein from transposon 17.6 [Trichinella sp. T8]